MKTVLLLLLLSTCRTSAHSRASLKVIPNWSQFFEYEKITLSCDEITSGEWTVWRYTTEGLKLSDCTSGWGTESFSTCEMKTVKRSNSGVYWCQSTHGHSSNAINIAVSENPVILQIPAAPVVEGDNITLLCRTKNPSNKSADFFKNGIFIKNENTCRMTIYQASKADQGSYKCSIGGRDSPSSWLLIQGHNQAGVVASSVNTTVPDRSTGMRTRGERENNNVDKMDVRVTSGVTVAPPAQLADRRKSQELEICMMRLEWQKDKIDELTKERDYLKEQLAASLSKEPTSSVQDSSEELSISSLSSDGSFDESSDSSMSTTSSDKDRKKRKKGKAKKHKKSKKRDQKQRSRV